MTQPHLTKAELCARTFHAQCVIKRNVYEQSRRLHRLANMPDISEGMRYHIAEMKWLRFTQDLHHFPLEMFAGVGVRSIL